MERLWIGTQDWSSDPWGEFVFSLVFFYSFLGPSYYLYSSILYIIHTVRVHTFMYIL